MQVDPLGFNSTHEGDLPNDLSPAAPRRTAAEEFDVARNTGAGSRLGSVSGRTQIRNPKTGDFVKRDDGVKSPHKGEFMDVKEGGKRFKGVAAEPDGRRSPSGGTARKSPDGNKTGRANATEKKARLAGSRNSVARRPTPNGSKTTKTAVKRASPASRKDALALLMADHKEARAMFREYKRLIKSGASDEKRREVAERVCHALTAHAQIEEEIFYPAAREAGIKRDVMDEAAVEHQSAKSLISQIKSMSPADRIYDAKVSVLSEFIDHHVEEEESQMFRLCRKSSMDLQALGEEMAARKAELTKPESLLIRVARKAIDALLPG